MIRLFQISNKRLLANAPSSFRGFRSSPPTFGMEEFFAAPLKDGQQLVKAGRSWTAAELRNKSFEDLHVLWFLCLKERNYLLSERLYYRQIGMAAADPGRLGKVRFTMARIKVVIGERARAEAAMKADIARAAKVAAVEATLRARLEGPLSPTEAAAASLTDSKLIAAKITNDIVSESIVSTTSNSTESASSPSGRLTAAMLARRRRLALGSKAAQERAAAQGDVVARLNGRVMVTYKKFGRKYTVPEEDAPKEPTRQEIKRAARTSRYFTKARAMMNAPPALAPKSAGLLWAKNAVPIETSLAAERADRFSRAGLNSSKEASQSSTVKRPSTV
jgi:ribosomal protein L29